MENGGSSDSASSSDNDSDLEVDEGDEAPKNREKRDVAWCGVDTEKETPPRAIWPPPQSPSTSGWLNLRHVRVGNPLMGSKMQLYCKTDLYLAVYPDGTIKGTNDENDLHTYLELKSAGQAGHVKIKGLLTNLFVAMDKRGRLFGEADQMLEETIFIESFQGLYKTYLSKIYAHLGWYIGVKRSGKIKRGPKTRYGQKAIKFLSIRSKFE